MLTSIQLRCWRAFADLKTRLSGSGSTDAIDRVFSDVARSDAEAWTRETAVRHDAYRREVAPASGSVAIVCVTRRPHMIGAVARHVAVQDIDQLDLVVVTNSEQFQDVEVLELLADVDGPGRRTRVLDRSADCSLGACLNAAMATTDARFVAKFDDDDLYGPSYLSDALRAHAYAGAGVVGKHTYYALMAETDELLLRFPAREFSYSSTLAGGTLLIDRERTGDLAFDNVSLGEDRAFLAACHRRGISTFAADRFNFVQVRSTDHSWRPSRAEFTRNAEVVANGLDAEMVYR